MAYLIDVNGYRLIDANGYLLRVEDDFALITDRTKADVELVSALAAKGWNMTEEELLRWLSGMKGAYNYTDLNRVEKAVQYVSNRFKQAGFDIVLDTKTDWTYTDFPELAQMERYLENGRRLRQALPMAANVPQVPANMNKLTYEDANNIEKILLVIDDVITNISLAWYYSGDLFAGEV